MARFIQGSCGIANIDNDDRVRAEDVSYDNSDGFYPPGTDTVQEALEAAGGGSVASMTPTVEGTAYGDTDQLGRTMLGYGVDASSSNNVAFWSHSSGASQGLCNSTSAVTAFVDTDTMGATMLNSVVMLEAGSVAGANLSNSAVIGRGSSFSGGADYTQSNLMVNEYVAQVGDELSSTQGMIRGSFEQPSQFRNSVVMGEVNNLRTLGVADGAIVIRPGNAGGLPVRVAAGGCLIGQGVPGTAVSTGEFRLSTYNNYYVDGVPAAAAPHYLSYDASTGRVTYSPTPGTVSEMTPTVLGTAFGEQDRVKQLNSLGEGVSISAATAQATARYNASVAGTPQAAVYISSIFDDNRNSQNATTSVNNSVASINETGIGDSAITTSTVLANTSTLTGTPVTDSITTLNVTGAGGGATMLASTVVANKSTLNSATMDKTVMVANNLNAGGLNLVRATVVGDATSAVMGSLLDTAFIASGGAQPVTMNGAAALYLGNQSATETVATREAWISSYDKFFLRTLRQATAANVAVYNANTAELTHTPFINLLPLKQPAVLGGQYGISSSANGSEVNGINSFTNYAAGPAALTGVTSVGNNQYQASTPASNSFVNDIFLGRLHQFTGASSIQNTLIAANTVGISSITKILDCNMVVPRSASLTFGYSGEINGACFMSSGSVTNVIDPQYATVLSSGGTVNPGQTNLVLASGLAGSSVVMNGTGNTLIKSSSSALAYNWPAGISNTTVIQGGNLTIAPTANGQLCASHSTLRMPNLTNAATTNNQRPVVFDPSTGYLTPTSDTLTSRTARFSGTTNASGQVTFNTGVVSATAANVSIQATVRNASTTVAYVAQVNAVTASSFTIQVFNSVTVVLASPSMAPSGAGITVTASMSY